MDPHRQTTNTQYSILKVQFHFGIYRKENGSAKSFFLLEKLSAMPRLDRLRPCESALHFLTPAINHQNKIFNSKHPEVRPQKMVREDYHWVCGKPSLATGPRQPSHFRMPCNVNEQRLLIDTEEQHNMKSKDLYRHVVSSPFTES